MWSRAVAGHRSWGWWTGTLQVLFEHRLLYQGPGAAQVSHLPCSDSSMKTETCSCAGAALTGNSLSTLGCWMGRNLYLTPCWMSPVNKEQELQQANTLWIVVSKWILLKWSGSSHWGITVSDQHNSSTIHKITPGQFGFCVKSEMVKHLRMPHNVLISDPQYPKLFCSAYVLHKTMTCTTANTTKRWST